MPSKLRLLHQSRLFLWCWSVGRTWSQGSFLSVKIRGFRKNKSIFGTLWSLTNYQSKRMRSNFRLFLMLCPLSSRPDLRTSSFFQCFPTEPTLQSREKLTGVYTAYKGNPVIIELQSQARANVRNNKASDTISNPIRKICQFLGWHEPPWEVNKLMNKSHLLRVPLPMPK